MYEVLQRTMSNSSHSRQKQLFFLFQLTSGPAVLKLKIFCPQKQISIKIDLINWKIKLLLINHIVKI